MREALRQNRNVVIIGLLGLGIFALLPLFGPSGFVYRTLTSMFLLIVTRTILGAATPERLERWVIAGAVWQTVAAGASSVMIGSLFAGTEEAPGEVILFQGRSYKSYRGMGSIGAMKAGSADRYFQENDETANPNQDKLVPEGIEGRVPYKGSVVNILFQMAGGLRAAMGYCGCATIEDMRTRAEFVEITSAGIRESHVHDVQITKEAPNYHIEG